MASPVDGMDVAIAVQLFEQGFPEARVREALRVCRTLPEALKWLSPDAGDPDDESGASAREDAKLDPVAAASSVQPGRPSTSSGQPRRRFMRKVATTDTLPGGETASPPVSPPEACSEGALPQRAPAPLASASAGGASFGLFSEMGATAAPSPTPVIDLSSGGAGISFGAIGEQRDATGWWKAASTLWRTSTTQSFGGDDGGEDAGSDSGEQASEGSQDAPAESEPAAGSNATDEGMHQSPAQRVKREQEDSPRKSEGVAQRPPATPCSAITSPMARDSGHMCMSARRLSSTPLRTISGSPASPDALRLNKTEECCGICCNDVPSMRAVRLGCRHGWYCGSCVLRHAEARLAAGAAVVTCPECCTPIAERDLRKLLPTDLMERLLSRSLEKAVSAAADLYSCPTPNCPMRVALEEGETPRLKCTICKKTSCLRCGVQPFHRGTCEEFQAKRGAKRKADHEGFADLMKWIEETGTKQCPTCRMAVTKQTLDDQDKQYKECHKMLCRNCSTRFCFKCLAILSDSYSCGCTIDAHGFIDPNTGKRLNHLDGRKRVATAKGKGKAKAAPKKKTR